MFCNGNIVVSGRDGNLMADLDNIRTDDMAMWNHKPDVEAPISNPLRPDQSAHHSRPSHVLPLFETHRLQQELDLQREIVSGVSRRCQAALVATCPDRHFQDLVFVFDQR